MPRRYGKPFREPAGGWKTYNGVRSLFNHYIPDDAARPHYAADYSGKVIQADGVTLGNPYERVVASSCGPDDLGDCPSSSGCPHIPWIGNDPDLQYSLSKPFPNPSFPAAGNVNLAACEKIGFKSVLAKRSWHGLFGFNYDSSGILCTGSGARSQRKYLNYDVDILCTQKDGRRHYVGGGDGGYRKHTYTAHNSTSVDANSGVITGAGTFTYRREEYDTTFPSACTIDNYFVSDDTYDICKGEEPPGGFGGSIGLLINSILADLICDPRCLADSRSMDDSTVYPAGNNPIYSIVDCALTGAGVSKAVGGYTASYTTAIGSTTRTCSVTVTRSETAYHAVVAWEQTTTGSFECEGNTINYIDYDEKTDYDITVTLSNANNFSTLVADCKTLLNEWDLTDDRIYPWRSDATPQYAPKVTRNEPGDVAPNVLYCDGATDPNANFYDGEIVGAPLDPLDYSLPANAILTGWFNPAHQVWKFEVCPDHPTDPPQWYIEGYGEKNEGQNGIPITATQWTDNFEASRNDGTGDGQPNSFPAAYQMTRYGIRLQKYAEIKLLWPSYDFNQPYGAQRLEVDPADPDYCANWRDETPVYRFPSAPPFGLNVVTTSTADAWATTNLYMATAPSWRTADTTTQVDLYESTTNPQGQTVPKQSALATNLTMTRDGVNGGIITGDYRTAAYVIPTGMKPQWCDDNTKGQAVYLNWKYNLDSDAYTEFNAALVEVAGFTPVGVPYQPCRPSVMCYSPNGETWNDGGNDFGKTYDFGSFVHGERWLGEFVQIQTTPSFLEPKLGCDEDDVPYPVAQDDGTCREDELSPILNYYAHALTVEPFLALPTTVLLDGSTDTAPNPYTNGFAWKTYSPVTYAPGTQPADGNIAYPQTLDSATQPGTSPPQGFFPWTLYTNTCSCVQSEGRFEEDYKQFCRKWINGAPALEP